MVLEYGTLRRGLDFIKDVTPFCTYESKQYLWKKEDLILYNCEE